MFARATEDPFDDMFDEDDMEMSVKTESKNHSKSKESPGYKSVTFDEENIINTRKEKVDLDHLGLKHLKKEISKYYNSGKIEERNQLLAEFCTQCNEVAQNMDLSTPEEQERALDILNDCIDTIKENSNKLNYFPELNYETFNNMARCTNIQGNIKKSLDFLLQAMHNVERLQQEQDPGSVTIMPELSLNICNALIYLKVPVQALQYADKAVTSSKACINSLYYKLDKLETEDPSKKLEHARLTQLLNSQINLHIQGFQAKGMAYEKLKSFTEAIREYNHAKRVVETNFGTENKMFLEIVNQISAANVNLKSASYNGTSEIFIAPQKIKRPKTPNTKNPTPKKLQEPKANGLSLAKKNQSEKKEKFDGSLTFNDRMSEKEYYQMSIKKELEGASQLRILRHIKAQSIVTERQRQVKQGFGYTVDFYDHDKSRLSKTFPTRPKSSQPQVFFYDRNNQTLGKKEEKEKKKKKKKKEKEKEKEKEKKEPKPNTVLIEMQSLREEIQKREVQNVEIRIKQMRESQEENQRAMIQAVDDQKNMIMQKFMQDQERLKNERERKMMEEMQETIIKQNQGSHQHIFHNQGNHHQSQLPFHPQFGPAVFDYYWKSWTYPWAQHYSQGQPISTSPEKENKQLKMQEIGSQTQKKDVFANAVQTSVILSPREKEKETNEKGNSPIKQREDTVEMGTSPESKAQEFKIEQIEEYEKEKINAIYRRRQARRQPIEQAKARKASISKTDENCFIIAKHFQFNPSTEHIEILYVHLMAQKKMCTDLKFTIWDLATQNPLKIGTYNLASINNNFSAQELYNKASASLKNIGWEDNPFKKHMNVVGELVNDQRKDKIKWSEAEKMEIKLWEDKEPPSSLEKVKFVQRRVRMYLHKIKVTNNAKSVRLVMVDKKIGERVKDFLVYSVMKDVQCVNCKKKKFFNVKLIKHEYVKTLMERLRRDIQWLFGKNQKQFADWEIPTYSLIATEIGAERPKEALSLTQKIQGLRLPENNPALIKAFVSMALEIKVSHILDGISNPQGQCNIELLQILRMKVKHKDLGCKAHLPDYGFLKENKHGCILKLDFEHNEMLYKVYKRIRFERSQSNRKVHDWKIKVMQLNSPHSWDYLVVRRLPVPLNEMKEELIANLACTFDQRLIPFPIQFIEWNAIRKGEHPEIKDKNLEVQVQSQRCLDLINSERFETKFCERFYCTQFDGLRRYPTSEERREQVKAPFYELFIQRKVPIETQRDAYRYQTEAYNDRKAKTKTKLNFLDKSQVKKADSDSEDERDPEKYKDLDCFWDKTQLENMQLDDLTINRHYMQITVSKPMEKQCLKTIEFNEETVQVPQAEVMFQYFMTNLIVKDQPCNGGFSEPKSKIELGLNIRANHRAYVSDRVYSQTLYSHQLLRQKKQLSQILVNSHKYTLTEIYMAQDVQRWRNMRYSVTCFFIAKEINPFVVEVVNVEMPSERTYCAFKSLSGLRGTNLKFYIDCDIKFYQNEEEAHNKIEMDQTGNSAPIESCEFIRQPEEFIKQMRKEPKYQNWEVEGKKESEEKVEEVEEKNTQKQEKEKFERNYKGAKYVKALRIIQRYVKCFKARFELKMIKQRQGELICKFSMNLGIKNSVEMEKIQVIIRKKKEGCTISLANRINQVKQIQCKSLPKGLDESSSDIEYKKVFRQSLRVSWFPKTMSKGGVNRIQEAFFDYSETQVKVQQKIIDVKVWGKDIWEEVKQMREEHGIKQKDVKKKRRVDSSSSSSELDEKLDKTEIQAIQDDVKFLKMILKQIRKKAKEVPGGIRGWFNIFDRDGSDEIEFLEYVKMMNHLKVEMEDREFLLIFKTFDRSNIFSFNYAEFSDILEQNLVPNYKRIVFAERKRFKEQGIRITVLERRKRPVIVRERAPEIIEEEEEMPSVRTI